MVGALPLIQNRHTGMWQLHKPAHRNLEWSWCMLYNYPTIGDPCKDEHDEWTACINIAPPSDAYRHSPLYATRTRASCIPVVQFLRTTNLFGSIVVNALRTGFTTVVASWVHGQRFYNGGELVAFLAAVGTYYVVSVVLWVFIGYGGSAISSTTNIVLDRGASQEFYRRYGANIPTNQGCGCTMSQLVPLISIELDNTLVGPEQYMYCVKQVLCMTTGPTANKAH